jgi:hypothetical protein
MDYGELRTQFTSILNRRDLTPTLRDTFLDLSISRIQRELRTPFMEKAVVVTVDTEWDGLEIPSDFLQVISITIDTGTTSKLIKVDIGTALKYAETVGLPRVYARQGNKFIIGPTPGLDTELTLTYYSEQLALENDSDETTLLTVGSDLVIYGALVYAAEYFLDKRYEGFENRYQTMLMGMQHQADLDDLSNATLFPCHNLQDEI